MLKLHEYYSRPLKNGDVGIEAEVEFFLGKEPILDIPESWVHTHDDSLKNGVEYVARQPFKVGPTLMPKIKSLTDLLNAPNSGVDHNNPRASIHVHVNVQTKTPVQIWNAILAYWLVEGTLMRYCKPHRQGNHFCMRVEDAPGILLKCYAEIDSNTSPFSTLSENGCKYGAVNLATVANYGSLEFRGLHATYDPDELHMWSTSLHYLVEKASTFESPAALMDHYIQATKDSFLYAMLPYEFVAKIIALDQDYLDRGKRTKRVLAPLAYYVNWSEWQTTQEKAFQKRKAKISPYASGLLAQFSVGETVTSHHYYVNTPPDETID